MQGGIEVLGRAVQRSGGLAQRGREVLEADGDIHPDAEHRPALLHPALDQDAGDLVVVDEHVVGPLDASGVAHGLGHGHPGLERDESGVVHAQDDARAAGPAGGARSRSVPVDRARRSARRRSPGRRRRPGPGEMAGPARWSNRCGAGGGADGRGRGHAVTAPRAGGARSRGAARLAAGVPAVDRDSQHAPGVLVDEQLAGRDVGEGHRVVGSPATPRASLDQDRVPEAQPEPARSSWPTFSAALPKRSTLRTCAISVPSASCRGRGARCPRARSGRAGRPPRRAASPWPTRRRRARRCRDRGRCARPGRAATSSGRSRPPRRRRRSARWRGPAGRCRAPSEQPLVLGRAQRDRAPLGADLGIDDGEVDPGRCVGQGIAQREGGRADLVAGQAVGEDRPRGRRARCARSPRGRRRRSRPRSRSRRGR